MNTSRGPTRSVKKAQPLCVTSSQSVVPSLEHDTQTRKPLGYAPWGGGGCAQQLVSYTNTLPDTVAVGDCNVGHMHACKCALGCSSGRAGCWGQAQVVTLDNLHYLCAMPAPKQRADGPGLRGASEPPHRHAGGPGSAAPPVDHQCRARGNNAFRMRRAGTVMVRPVVLPSCWWQQSQKPAHGAHGCSHAGNPFPTGNRLLHRYVHVTCHRHHAHAPSACVAPSSGHHVLTSGSSGGGWAAT